PEPQPEPRRACLNEQIARDPPDLLPDARKSRELTQSYITPGDLLIQAPWVPHWPGGLGWPAGPDWLPALPGAALHGAPLSARTACGARGQGRGSRSRAVGPTRHRSGP